MAGPGGAGYPRRVVEDEAAFSCPYCGEALSLAVDPTAGARQRFVHDCEVCCRPIEVEVTIDRDGTAAIRAARDEEVL